MGGKYPRSGRPPSSASFFVRSICLKLLLLKYKFFGCRILVLMVLVMLSGPGMHVHSVKRTLVRSTIRSKSSHLSG